MVHLMIMLDRRLLASAVLTLAATLGRASDQTSWQAVQGSDWAVEVKPPSAPDDVRKLSLQAAISAREKGYADPDRARFEDKLLHDGVLDQICRNFRIPLKKDVPLEKIGGYVLGEYERRLRQLPPPSDRQGLLETARVAFSASRNVPLNGAQAGVSLSMGASADGISLVLRPLESAKTCDELDTIIDLLDFKTVLPFTAERIAEMSVGELWQLPLRGSWNVAAPLGTSNGPSTSVSVTVGGRTKSGEAAMTLLRMSEEELRFRFRIQEALITTQGGNVVATIPALAIGRMHGLLGRFISQGIARQFARYVDSYISYFEPESDGQSIVLELILDPRDKSQLESLAQVVQGDLSRLLELLKKRNGFLPLDYSTDQNATEISEHYGGKIGARQAVTAANTFDRDPRNAAFKIPFVFHYLQNESLDVDRLALLGDSNEVHLHHADENKSYNFFDMIFWGPRVRDNRNISSQFPVLVETPEKVPARAIQTPPLEIYVHYHGFLNMPQSMVQRVVKQYEHLTSMIGLERAGGPNERTRIPVQSLTAEPASLAPDGDSSENLPRYEKGSMMLSILLSPSALHEIMSAQPERIVRAYLNTLDAMDRKAVSAMSEAGFEKKAVWNEARRAANEAMDSVEPYYFKSLADTVTSLIADLVEVREAPDNDLRAAAWAKAKSGRGRSGLAHDRILMIVLQLVDPKDVRADFNLDIKPGIKGQAPISERYRYNGGIDSDPLVRQIAKLRARFQPPSETTD